MGIGAGGFLLGCGPRRWEGRIRDMLGVSGRRVGVVRMVGVGVGQKVVWVRFC